MKIAIIYDLLYPYSIGGAESRNFSLAKNLVLKGHEVHLFGVKMWRGKKTKKVSKKFYIHGISKYGNMYNFSGKRKIIEPIKYSIALFFELLKHDFDIIDVSAFPYFPIFSCELISKIKKIPLVTTWHEVWDDYWKIYHKNFGFIGKMIERICAKISLNNICVSDLTAIKLKKLGAKNITIIANGIDIDKVKDSEPLKEKYDIISIGRHLKHKNFDFLIKIISLLVKTHPKLKALIIGEGPETLKLLKMRRTLKLENNLEILSFTKDKNQMYKYLKSSKLFVLLSELEGFSIVAFEAMAAGLPIVTIDAKNNALKDYIIEGKNGYVSKKDTIDILHKISYILKNADKFSKFCEKYVAKYDEKIITTDIEKQYMRIIKK